MILAWARGKTGAQPTGKDNLVMSCGLDAAREGNVNEGTRKQHLIAEQRRSRD
jgi:hypothetical protein